MTAPPAQLRSLPDYLALHAAATPAREAAVDAGEVVSYGELDQRVTAFAQTLRAAGVQPGQRIAFHGAPGLPFWISLLGTQRAGCVWLGLHPQHTSRELTHILRDAQPVQVLTTQPVGTPSRAALQAACEEAGLPPAVELEGRGTMTTIPRRADAPAEMSASAHAGAHDVSLIVYTSGSTGAPKGALLRSEGLVENGWWLAARMDFEPVRGLVNLPVNHIGCVGDVCATILVAGGTAVFMERFDPALAVRSIVEQRITWLPQVPAQFQLLVTAGGMDARALATVRHLTWGGAAMPEPLVVRLREWVPDLFNSYGLTECSGTITLTDRGASVAELTATVGRPVAPGRLRVVDAQGQPLAPGGVGEVQIRGPHVFHGYLNQPEASRNAFTADGWLRTGDLGAIDDQGRLALRGRSHEMFKSGGYNVYPREVEAVLEALPGVELCAVVPVPDPLWSEVGVAFVKADPARLQPEQLREHCLARLARYKVPKRFHVRQALPLLPIGKVDKARLKAEASMEQQP